MLKEAKDDETEGESNEEEDIEQDDYFVSDEFGGPIQKQCSHDHSLSIEANK